MGRYRGVARPTVAVVRTGPNPKAGLGHLHARFYDSTTGQFRRYAVKLGVGWGSAPVGRRSTQRRLAGTAVTE